MRLHFLVYFQTNRTNFSRELDATEKRVTLGRKDCDFLMADEKVSRLHASVHLDKKGQLTVRDMCSTNGTYLNDERIQQAPLKKGDELRLGDTVLMLVDIEQDEVSRQSPASTESPREMPGSDEKTLEYPKEEREAASTFVEQKPHPRRPRLFKITASEE